MDRSRHAVLVEALDALAKWAEKMEIGKVNKKMILNRENPVL
ncbi:MAG: hypothetical protein SCK57_13760 [Bacillota bacterium]|nr:hypothetical protein [Bacillota bacterium]